MKSKFKAIIVSKDDKFAANSVPEDSSFVSVEYVRNNSLPLTAVYNKALEAVRADKSADFIIFMHADVVVDFKHMLAHAEQCSSKYDVMGLCGCAKIDVKQTPLNWFCGSRPFPESRWGCVTHGEIGNSTSYFSSHSPNVLDHEVACIDGLCIILGPNAVNSSLKFDERFKFDQYDTDLSLQCVLERKLKLGVIVEISLQHYSVGKSILTREFLEHEKDLREKWNI